MARSGTTEQLRARATKHGLKYHRLYQIYLDMMNRCYNPKVNGFKYYGARGIKVCDAWRQDRTIFFSWALVGWRRGLTLDRRENDGNYSPENCHWVTTRRNNRNRRSIKLNLADAAAIKDLFGIGVGLSFLAALYGIKYHTVYAVAHGTNWPDAEQYKWTGRGFE
jgi:hypothetical protein